MISKLSILVSKDICKGCERYLQKSYGQRKISAKKLTGCEDICKNCKKAHGLRRYLQKSYGLRKISARKFKSFPRLIKLHAP